MRGIAALALLQGSEEVRSEIGKANQSQKSEVPEVPSKRRVSRLYTRLQPGYSMERQGPQGSTLGKQLVVMSLGPRFVCCSESAPLAKTPSEGSSTSTRSCSACRHLHVLAG